jgi:hypothetical protein
MWQLCRIADPAIAKVQPGRFLRCRSRYNASSSRVQRTMAMVLCDLPAASSIVNLKM